MPRRRAKPKRSADEDVIDEGQGQGVVCPTTTAHSMLHFRGTSLFAADASALWELILKFIVSPEEMTTLCAISRAAAKASWTPATWDGNCVNTTRLKPRGSLAMRHHQLWKRARYVVGGRWQYRCISLLLSRKFGLWRWAKGGGSSVIVAGGGPTYTVQMARAPVTLPASMIIEHGSAEKVYVGLAREQADPLAIVACILGSKKRKRCENAFCFAELGDLEEGQLLRLGAESLQVDDNWQVPLVGRSGKKMRRGVVPAVVSVTGCSILPCWSLVT